MDKKEKKIFSLATMQTTDAVTVFVRCPEIGNVQSQDVNLWINMFVEYLNATEKKEESLMYEHCFYLLKAVKDITANVEVWCAYNVPCVTGNEVMFVFKFEDREDRNRLISKIVELEEEYA